MGESKKAPEMFRLVSQAKAWWPVTWNGVTEEGEIVENRIELRFLLVGEDEFIALLMESVSLKPSLKPQPGDAGEAPRVSEMMADFVLKIADDWRGVGAENGESLKFGRDNLRLLVNVAGVFEAVLAALAECRAGGKDRRAGN
jgi:hypothetical protein